MVAADFEVDDLVWAKMKNFPFWPAKIANPPPNIKNTPSKKAQHYVFFFGSENYAWIMDENIVHHSEEMLQSTSTKKKSTIFKSAIKQIIDESEKVPMKSKTPVKENDKSDLCAESPLISKPERKGGKSKDESAKKQYVKEKNKSDLCAESPLLSKLERKGGKSKYESAKKRYFAKVQKASQNEYFAKMHKKVRKKYFTDRIQSSRPKETSSIELNGETYQGVLSNLTGKIIPSTNKKIGFLGLGKMGKIIVQRLIETDHDVTIWNRTSDKCMEFVKLGAQCGVSASSVVAECDIIFCCVSGIDAVKSIIFGNNGVLAGLEGTRGKGYVELSTIDPTTCEELAEAIRQKNGIYLESPITETKKGENPESVAVLCAGDYELFIECESCFNSFASDVYYISSMVGAGSNMNLLLNMFMNTVYAALAESLALIRKLNLDQDALLEFLRYGPLNCSLLQKKGKDMALDDFFIDNTFKYQQRDLSLALTLGNATEQPLALAAAASELYKNPSRLLYDHVSDVSPSAPTSKD